MPLPGAAAEPSILPSFPGPSCTFLHKYRMQPGFFQWKICLKCLLLNS
jgi:hypothetical protein